MAPPQAEEITGTVSSIERYAVHDGPGIRTLVFLKGCPLRCLWCDNPESQKVESQIFLITNRCIGCGQCLAACTQGAARVSKKGEMKIDRKLCTGCGKCIEVCYAMARVLVGERMTVQDVLKEIMKDLAFYKRSGGGATLSGGEPLMQAEFAHEILEGCHERSIHTAIETSGYTRWETLEMVLKHVDLVFLDIKHMDSVKHQKFTGVPNEPILENAKRISCSKSLFVVRVPIVPGYNDSEENIKATVEYVAELENVTRIELLAYHGYGEPKYERLGLKCKLRNLRPPSNEHMQRLREIVVSQGLRCQIL